MSDNIVSIDTVRIERNIPRKCTCDEYNKRFTVDTRNRQITCGCGLIADPYEAMEHIARQYERMNDSHQALNEQRKKWLKEKPHSVMFKELERNYRKGEMLPHCPKCERLFDYKDITSHGNADFYRRLEARSKGN